jgi:Tetracyclin repressor-like, C-terminal domain
VLGMGNWIYQWYSDSTRWSAEEIGRSFGLMALRGLTAKPQTVRAIANRAPDRQRDPVQKLMELRLASSDAAVLGYSLDPDQRRKIARRASIASASSK